MELTELSDYALPSGQLVEWLPTAQEHWTQWPRDPRRASVNHEAHLRDALEDRRRGECRQSWLGYAYRIEGAFDARAWRRAVDMWIDRHETLRTHVTVEGGQPARHTLPAGGVRIQGRPVGECVSPMSTYRHVQTLLDESTSPLTWPSYVFATIAEEDSFTVVCGADHSIMDGYSSVVVAAELHVLYAAATASADDVDICVAPLFAAVGLPEAVSYLDYSEQEQVRPAAAAAADPAVELWRQFFADTAATDGGLADGGITSSVCGFPLDVGGGAASGQRPAPQRTLSLWMLDNRAAEIVEARARDEGQGLFAALMAGFAMASAELTGADDFRTIVPLHTRSCTALLGALGWLVGLSPFHIRTAGATGLGDLIGPAGRELRRSRGASSVPFARVCELIGVRPRLPFVVSYMNLRGMPLVGPMSRWNTRWLRSGSDSADEYYFWFCRWPDGITVSVRFPGTTEATRDVHRIVFRFRALLTEFAEYGDTIRQSSAEPLVIRHAEHSDAVVSAWK